MNDLVAESSTESSSVLKTGSYIEFALLIDSAYLPRDIACVGLQVAITAEFKFGRHSNDGIICRVDMVKFKRRSQCLFNVFCATNFLQYFWT